MDSSPAFLLRQSLSSEHLAASIVWQYWILQKTLSKLQKAFVDFFCGGHYWLPSGVLCIPVNGQGLIHRPWATAQKLLYSSDSAPWINFVLTILQILFYHFIICCTLYFKLYPPISEVWSQTKMHVWAVLTENKVSLPANVIAIALHTSNDFYLFIYL